MSDLAEFLTARFDEDRQEIEDADLWSSQGAWTERLLARLEPRRRIVAECKGVTSYLGVALGDCVLVLLAQPYAGHPDFREEWLV